VVRSRGTWDLGLDYARAYRVLLARIREHRGRAAWSRYCYAIVLLVQLRNGSRVSEAVDAVVEMARAGKREVRVRVRKRRDGAVRVMVLPRELRPRDLAPCRDALSGDPERVVERVKAYAKRVLGWNTHSLRYAFITHLLRRGVSPSIIAKITGHATLDYILRYTQRKTAEEVLRSLG